MTVLLRKRVDFSLDSYESVAWDSQSVSIDGSALREIDKHRRNFLQLLNENPDLNVYGVTSGYGQRASTRLSPTEMRVHALSPPYATMAGFGGDLPARIKRGMLFARLTNFIEGNSAVSGALTTRVAAMLDAPLPRVPSKGIASAGEIVPLSSLFAAIWGDYELGVKEGLSLINGSPCATAVMADAVLSTRKRLAKLLAVFALSAEAMQAPYEHYAQELGDLYGDTHQQYVLDQIRLLMAPDKPTTKRRPYQAPVSWRILPRVLGFAFQSLAHLEASATVSLQSVTDNPMYVTASDDHPLGQVMSNGGYHNAMVGPLLDQLTSCFADLALLCDRQVSKLFDGNVSMLTPMLQAGDGYAGVIGFIAADYANQAQACAQRTGLMASEGGGFGQNDVSFPVFQAWQKLEEAGRCLDACAAILCVTASQALYVTKEHNVPTMLQPLLNQIRDCVPPIIDSRPLGDEIGRLAKLFTQEHYPVFTDTK